jgi:hypothetical protein
MRDTREDGGARSSVISSDSLMVRANLFHLGAEANTNVTDCVAPDGGGRGPCPAPRSSTDYEGLRLALQHFEEVFSGCAEFDYFSSGHRLNFILQRPAPSISVETDSFRFRATSRLD